MQNMLKSMETSVFKLPMSFSFQGDLISLQQQTDIKHKYILAARVANRYLDDLVKFTINH